jgi:hypothetical protein
MTVCDRLYGFSDRSGITFMLSLFAIFASSTTYNINQTRLAGRLSLPTSGDYTGIEVVDVVFESARINCQPSPCHGVIVLNQDLEVAIIRSTFWDCESDGSLLYSSSEAGWEVNDCCFLACTGTLIQHGLLFEIQGQLTATHLTVLDIELSGNAAGSTANAPVFWASGVALHQGNVTNSGQMIWGAILNTDYTSFVKCKAARILPILSYVGTGQSYVSCNVVNNTASTAVVFCEFSHLFFESCIVFGNSLPVFVVTYSSPYPCRFTYCTFGQNQNPSTSDSAYYFGVGNLFGTVPESTNDVGESLSCANISTETGRKTIPLLGSMGHGAPYAFVVPVAAFVVISAIVLGLRGCCRSRRVAASSSDSGDKASPSEKSVGCCQAHGEAVAIACSIFEICISLTTISLHGYVQEYFKWQGWIDILYIHMSRMTVFQGIFNGICIVLALAVIALIVTNRLKDWPVAFIVLGALSIVFRLVCVGFAARYRSDFDSKILWVYNDANRAEDNYCFKRRNLFRDRDLTSAEDVELTSGLLFVSLILQIVAILPLLIEFRPKGCGNFFILLLFVLIGAFGVFLFAFPVWLAGVAVTDAFSEMAKPRWIIGLVWAFAAVRIAALVGTAVGFLKGEEDMVVGCGVFMAIVCCAGGGVNYFYVYRQYRIDSSRSSGICPHNAVLTFDVVLLGFAYSELVMMVFILLPVAFKCCLGCTQDCGQGLADGLHEAATDWIDGNYDIVSLDAEGREVSRRQGGLPGLFK